MSIEDIEKIDGPEQAPPEKPLTDGAPEIKKLVSQMPEVVEDAVQASEEKEKAQAQENLGYKDNKGRAFDPAIHAVNADGTPVMTPTGRFKQIKPKASGVALPDLKAQDQTQGVSARHKAVAVTVVQVFIQTGFSIFGDDWLPEKSKEMNEEANLVEVTAVYCESIGLDDLPPGLVCATAFIAYGLRRFNKPRVKTIREKIGEWLHVKTTRLFLWLQNKKGFKHARSDPRDNTERKDDAGVPAGA